MDERIFSKLSEPVKKLVVSIQAFSNLEIKVKSNPYPISNTDPNPNAPSAQFSSEEAVIYFRDLDNIQEQSLLHLLLLLQRYWIEKVPQIVPVGNNPENFKVTSSIEVALERLIVVPQESNYGFEPFAYWNTTVKKNWESYPFNGLNDWARKKNFLLGWLTAANLVTDDKIKRHVEDCLSKEGFLPIAKKFNTEIISNLKYKEKCLSIVTDYLNIPKDQVLLRYFDVKNGRQEDIKFNVGKQSKPSGATGVTELKIEQGKQTQTFLRIPFPKAKDAIELIITNAFIANASKANLFSFEINDIEQNKENHLDFQLKTSEGVKFLELMEVAPLEKAHNYENAAASYKPYDFGKYIVKKIMGKSNKYVGIKKTGLILLIYITDWKFIFSEALIALLQFWTLQEKHSFANIYLYQPITDTEGIVHLIYPTPDAYWREFNADDYRDSGTQNLDPQIWQSE